MKIEWLHSKHKGHELTHWSVLGPMAILHSLQNPLEDFGGRPAARLHEIGARKFVSRSFEHQQAVGIFERLKLISQTHPTVLEAPAALVKTPHSGTIILTRFKADTNGERMTTLTEILKSGSLKQVKRATLSAATELALLNSQGVLHNHPSPGNILVDSKNNSHLIDPALLSGLRKGEEEHDLEYLRDAVQRELWNRQIHASNDQEKRLVTKWLARMPRRIERRFRETIAKHKTKPLSTWKRLLAKIANPFRSSK